MATWFYMAPSGQVGPLDDEQFQSLVISGDITSATPVWNPEMRNWAKFGQLGSSEPAGPFGSTLPPPLSGDWIKAAPVTAAATATATEISEKKGVDYGRAAATGRQHICCQCKNEFPDSIMQPFGGNWICRHCRLKMVETATARGHRQMAHAFEFRVFARRTGYIAFCLLFGTAVFFVQRPKYDNYFDAARKARLGLIESRPVANLPDLPAMPPLLFLTKSNLPDLATDHPFFLVASEGGQYAVAVAPQQTASDAPEIELRSKDSSGIYTGESVKAAGILREPIDGEKRDLLIARLMPAEFPSLPEVRKKPVEENEPLYFTHFDDLKKVPVVSTGAVRPVHTTRSGAVVYEWIEAGSLIGAPAVDVDGCLAGIVTGDPDRSGKDHMVFLTSAEKLAELIQRMPASAP